MSTENYPLEENTVGRIANMFNYVGIPEARAQLLSEGHSEDAIFLIIKAAEMIYFDRSGNKLKTPKKAVLRVKARGDDVSVVHKSTLALRFSDYRVRTSLTTTQVWTWKGGDAIIVLAADPYSRLPKGYTVLRIGKKVEVYEGPLAHALRTAGIENFKIV